MLRQGCRGRPLGWRRVFLLRSGAGMCARRRSNLSLASPPVAGREKVTKEKATPLSVSAALGPGVGSARGAGSGAGFSGAQALGAQCNCRITMQRSETRAQTPMPEWWAQRGFFAIHAFGRALLWR